MFNSLIISPFSTKTNSLGLDCFIYHVYYSSHFTNTLFTLQHVPSILIINQYLHGNSVTCYIIPSNHSLSLN